MIVETIDQSQYFDFIKNLEKAVHSQRAEYLEITIF